MKLCRVRLLLSFVTFVFFVLASSAAARAQLAAYGTVSVEHVSGLKCAEVVCGSNNGTVNPVGGGGGVFYDWRTYGPVRVGFDVRASSTLSNKNAVQYAGSPGPHIFSVLGGVRGSIKVPLLGMRPYAQGSVGWDRTNVSSPLTYTSGVEFRGFVGVDLPILPVMDFRVVELGAGALRSGGSSFPMESISTGLVFHFPTNRD